MAAGVKKTAVVANRTREGGPVGRALRVSESVVCLPIGFVPLGRGQWVALSWVFIELDVEVTIWLAPFALTFCAVGSWVYVCFLEHCFL